MRGVSGAVGAVFAQGAKTDLPVKVVVASSSDSSSVLSNHTKNADVCSVAAVRDAAVVGVGARNVSSAELARPAMS